MPQIGALSLRSDVFKAMFTHEADIKVVEIEDCHPNAIKIMLEFMYGSKNIDQQSFEKYADKSFT